MSGIRSLLWLIALAVGSVSAYAQTPSTGAYPTKPLKLLVGFAPGGGVDINARLLASKLSEFLGQQAIVENRPGAGTNIANEYVAKSPPDGYTLLMVPSTLAINPAIYKKVPYDALRDFAPITQTVSSGAILVVHPSIPVKTVKELIAFARARQGQLNYASAGAGTYPHMSMELFLSMAGLKMVHIPYKGTGPAMIDMIAGHVAVMSATILTGMPQIRSGRLRGLGITSAVRSPIVPEIPTIAESGLPGYEAVQWYGALVPVQVPKDIIARLHGEITRVLQMPDVKERFAGDGADPVGNTPEEFGRYIRDETVKWARVARAAGIKPE